MANSEYDRYKDKYEKEGLGNKIWNSLKIWEKVIVAKHNEEVINDALEYGEKCRRLNAPLLQEKHARDLRDIRKLAITVALETSGHDKQKALKELMYGYNASLYDDNARANRSADGIGRTPALIRDKDLKLKTLEGSSEYIPIEEDYEDTLNRLMMEADTPMLDVNEYKKQMEMELESIQSSRKGTNEVGKDVGSNTLNKEVSVGKSIEEIKNANSKKNSEVLRKRAHEITQRRIQKVQIVDDIEKGGDE